MASQPQIIMETFGLRDLHIEWKEALVPGTEQESKLDFGFGLDQMQDPAIFRIGLTFSDIARNSEGKEAYRISAHIMGFFRLAPGLTDEEKGSLLLGNGLAMLYSSLRGALLPISGCFPPGFRYTLPTVNLQEIVQTAQVQGGSNSSKTTPGVLPAKDEEIGRKSRDPKKSTRRPGGR